MKKQKYLNLRDPNLPNTKKIITDEIINKTGRNYIIKMNYNENKFGCSPKVREHIALLSPHIYPEYIDYDMIESFEKLTGFNNDEVYFANGSDAILDNIPKIFGPLKEHANVIIPGLTYARIENTCTIFDFEIKKVPLVNWKIDLNKMLEAIDDKTTIIYVVNPNMPTGTFNSHKDIIEFLNKVPKDVLVVIDEAYVEFAVGLEESYKNDRDILKHFDNVIITRTFSKMFGLASFRIGYCLSSKENITIFKKTGQYFPVSKYSFQAANAAMNDVTYYHNVLNETTKAKEYFYKQLDEMKIPYVKSFGNFIFLDLTNEKRFSNKDMENYLLSEYGVLIRCVQNFGIRITIGTEFENELLLKGIKEFYNKIEVNRI